MHRERKSEGSWRHLPKDASSLPQIEIYGRPPPYYMHCILTWNKSYLETASQGSEGSLGANLQEGSVHGPTSELPGGTVDGHVLTS